MRLTMTSTFTHSTLITIKDNSIRNEHIISLIQHILLRTQQITFDIIFVYDNGGNKNKEIRVHANYDSVRAIVTRTRFTLQILKQTKRVIPTVTEVTAQPSFLAESRFGLRDLTQEFMKHITFIISFEDSVKNLVI